MTEPAGFGPDRAPAVIENERKCQAQPGLQSIFSHVLGPDLTTNLGVYARLPRMASLRDLRPISSESIAIPPRDGVGVDDE
jgi:hypothetical protein